MLRSTRSRSLALLTLLMGCSGGSAVPGPSPSGGGSPSSYTPSADNPASDEDGALTGTTTSAQTGGSGGTGTAGVGGGSGGSGGTGLKGAGGGTPAPLTLETLCPSWVGDPNELVSLSAGNLHSMVSATRARAWLESGSKPPPNAVRGNDMVNFYHRAFPAGATSANGLDFGVELAQRKIAGQLVPGQYDLYVGVRAQPLTQRPPMVLTVLVDTSLPKDSFELARSVVKALGKGLRVGDHVNLLTTDSSQPVQRLEVSAAETELAALADSLEDSGKGDFVQAVQAAYGYANGDRKPGAWNRVLYVSNGLGNVTLVDSTPIAPSAATDPPVFFAAAGVGPPTGFHDPLLFEAARVGRGSFVFVDDASTIETLYTTRFDELFGYARDIGQLTVTLPWWIDSLDPPTVPTGQTGGDAGPATYLAPGGQTNWILHIKTCDPIALTVATSEVFKLSLGVTDPAAGTTTADTSVPIQPLAGAVEHPALDGYVATRAYGDALRSGDATRRQAAAELLGLLATGAADDPYTEMQKLLASYPTGP